MVEGVEVIRSDDPEIAASELLVEALSRVPDAPLLAIPGGSAYLIQAQRDYFGSHTYERVEWPGTFVHTDWANAG